MTTSAAGHVVVAPDKFKGSLSAADVAACVARGLQRAVPDLAVVEVPVADGGEGTLDAALAAGFRRVPVRGVGPTGEPVDAAIAVRDRTAVVELAVASGIAVLPGGTLSPLHASSMGTGQLIRAALEEGCRTVVLGVGGSACTDGGAGLLVGLGARLLDVDGTDLPLGGAALRQLSEVDFGGLDDRLHECSVVLAGDVDNPLLGPNGAVTVYGPQKGAGPDDVEALEEGLRRWVEVLAAAVGERAAAAAEEPGAGAAGGVGYAALAVLDADRRPGVDVVLDLVGFADHLAGARLVVTGEGSLDAQTLSGKTPAGVAAAARRSDVTAVAVAGRSLLRPPDLATIDLSAGYALTDLEPDPERCMREAGPLLERLAARVAADWLTAGAAGSGRPASHEGSTARG